MLKRSFLLITALFLLSGCKTLLTQQDSEKSLLETLKAYEATMRWGYPGQAYNFLRKDLARKTEIPTVLVATVWPLSLGNVKETTWSYSYMRFVYFLKESRIAK